MRGPASSLYGADAFLGAINVVTTAASDAAAARARLGAVRNHFMHDVEQMASGASGAFDWVLAGRLAMEDRSGITLPASSPAPGLPPFRIASDPTSGSHPRLRRTVRPRALLLQRALQHRRVRLRVGDRARCRALPKQLSATGGARFDWHNIYGAQVSPRVGLNGTIADNLHIKLLYGGAFKAPSPFLLYAVPYNVGGVIGNPDLKAQYVHTIEGEVSYELSKVLVASTSLSYNYLLNAAQFVAAGSNLSARNVARIGSLSWETGIEAHYQDRIAAYARFGYNVVRRETGRDSLYVTSLIGAGKRDAGSRPKWRRKMRRLNSEPFGSVWRIVRLASRRKLLRDDDAAGDALARFAARLRFQIVERGVNDERMAEHAVRPVVEPCAGAQHRDQRFTVAA